MHPSTARYHRNGGLGSRDSSGWFFVLIDSGMAILYLQAFLEGPKEKLQPPPSKDTLVEWLKSRWQNFKAWKHNRTLSRLDKIDKALGYLQTIVATLALLCLLIGVVLNAKANADMAQAYVHVSQLPEASTLTVTVSNTTSTTSGSLTCATPHCTITEVASQPITVQASASANVTYVRMVEQAELDLRAAQDAWSIKAQFDNAGTVLLVAFLFLVPIRWIAKKKRPHRTAS